MKTRQEDFSFTGTFGKVDRPVRSSKISFQVAAGGQSEVFKYLKRLYATTLLLLVLSCMYVSGTYHRLVRLTILAGLNGQTPYNQEHHLNETSVSIYVESRDKLAAFYNEHFVEDLNKQISECPAMPEGGQCIFQYENPKSDVVFQNMRMTAIHHPIRYKPGQILAVQNSESEASGTEYSLSVLQSADIRIDHHTSSDIIRTDACGIPWKKELYTTPSPSRRKGVALLMSNCHEKWRNDYIFELSKHIHIHSYGRCFHNTKIEETRDHFDDTYTAIAQKHRMVIAFENIIEKEYISEKIAMGFQSGVIPVYWGPPEIYQWVPGEHSFIDPQKFKGPKELAKYLKRVDEDDDLFRYHTTNLTFERARKTHTSYCDKPPWPCRLCSVAQQIKLSRNIGKNQKNTE